MLDGRVATGAGGDPGGRGDRRRRGQSCRGWPGSRASIASGQEHAAAGQRGLRRVVAGGPDAGRTQDRQVRHHALSRVESSRLRPRPGMGGDAEPGYEGWRMEGREQLHQDEFSAFDSGRAHRRFDLLRGLCAGRRARRDRTGSAERPRDRFRRREWDFHVERALFPIRTCTSCRAFPRPRSRSRNFAPDYLASTISALAGSTAIRSPTRTRWVTRTTSQSRLCQESTRPRPRSAPSRPQTPSHASESSSAG